MAELHDNGEEYLLTNNVDGDDFDVGLYNSSDSLDESDDATAITTEPDDAQQYARQTKTFNVENDVGGSAGDWGIETDTVTFETDDNTQEVDKYFVVESGTDDMVFTGNLEQSRELSDIDTLNVDNIGGELS